MGREGEVSEVERRGKRKEDRRGCGEGRRWRWRLDADADAGIGAALTVPLGAQKICSRSARIYSRRPSGVRLSPLSQSESDGNSNACASSSSEWFSSASCRISPSSQYRGLTSRDSFAAS